MRCVVLIAGLIAGAFAPLPAQADAALQVVVSTSLVGDVVRQVAGARAAVAVLLPLNADAHTFEPSPRDLAAVAEADLVFVNGFNLEAQLLAGIAQALEGVAPVSASEGISARGLEDGHADEPDPHVWLDPANVLVWVDNIQAALGAADPDGAEGYAARADAYRAALVELDAWIESQVAQIPADARRLVTDHDVFGYFADRYGFEVVGAVFPGFSTLAEPSAREIAELEDAIRRLGVRAVFVGNTVNPALAQRVAEDTGVRVVRVYTGSLSEPEGPATTYLDYMRFNVAAIRGALAD